jgi:hypothetical protein
MNEQLTLNEAQEKVREFANRNGWEDYPNIDKFDHLHEELISMSQHLRYKSREDMEEYILENREIFVDGIGDTLFALCRLANQLGVNMEEAFAMASNRTFGKYVGGQERNILNPDNSIT